VLSGRDGSELWTYRGTGDYEYVGATAVAIVDADGDGVEDLAAGVGEYGRALSWLLLSGKTGSLLGPLDPDDSLIPARGGESDATVTLDIPDLDGDGHPDRLLGQLVAAGEIGGNRGRATMVSGASGAVIRCFNEPPYEPVQLPGGIDLRWGTELRLLTGDVNGDAQCDVILVVTGSCSPWTITVFSGVDGRILLYASTGAPWPAALWIGPVIVPGDLDGDGRDDLVLGASLPGAVFSVVAVKVELPEAH
jgi:hypothetical protein